MRIVRQGRGCSLRPPAGYGGRTGAAQVAEAPWLQVGPVALLASGPDHLELGLGAFELLDDDPSLQGSVEYRFGRKLAFVGPALGLLANVDGGVFGYLGLYLDLAVGPFRVTPMLAAGGYREGSSEDLGGVFQFRQSLAIAWRFQNGHQLGVKLAHISNADINDANPGAEDLMVTYALPLGPVF
jgi:lipid A 3-O-deacylase